jgi:DNA repair exonuclease SbcCD ATPase subunit
MENEEIVKRIEWLDGERRKDRQTINELQEQVSKLQEVIALQKRELSNINKDNKKSFSSVVRLDEYEETNAKLKAELAKSQRLIEKRLDTMEQTIAAQRSDDRDTYNKKMLELQGEIKALNELKKSLQSRGEDDFRLNQKLEDLARQLADQRSSGDEQSRLVKILDDNYRVESKRLSDLQVELNTLRKRIDEDRNLSDAQKEYLKKLEGQIHDLVNREKTRNQEQIEFIEKQSLLSVDRENLWKDWQEEIQQMKALSENFHGQVRELETLNREIKQGQSDFEVINQRLERRINEITEMNRLTEERFRQEWVAFKADDQKRWTNYSLSQEETNREGNREISKIDERITSLEDAVQNLLDTVQVIHEETEKRIKGLLMLANEYITSYERTALKKG